MIRATGVDTRRIQDSLFSVLRVELANKQPHRGLDLGALGAGSAAQPPKAHRGQRGLALGKDALHPSRPLLLLLVARDVHEWTWRHSGIGAQQPPNHVTVLVDGVVVGVLMTAAAQRDRGTGIRHAGCRGSSAPETRLGSPRVGSRGHRAVVVGAVSSPTPSALPILGLANGAYFVAARQGLAAAPRIAVRASKHRVHQALQFFAAIVKGLQSQGILDKRHHLQPRDPSL
mmetsp:Transcript_154341/g.494947  ORF Transcript_154341/g.494947 Transcript_154341/m.494947 type:complete len:230 (-) Transcript_154341:1236-1925(-)